MGVANIPRFCIQPNKHASRKNGGPLRACLCSRSSTEWCLSGLCPSVVKNEPKRGSRCRVRPGHLNGLMKTDHQCALNRSSLLLRALYGHPGAGIFWEQHCDEGVVNRFCFELVETWPSCYYHSKWQLLLTVYVDDFNMSGPEKCTDVAWQSIHTYIEMEDPAESKLYLGCKHTCYEHQCKAALVRNTLYAMKDYLISSIRLNQQVFVAAAGKEAMLRQVATPSIEEYQARALAKALVANRTLY